MRINRSVLIVACALLLTQTARAADPFDPFRPPTLGEMIGQNVEKLLSDLQKFRESGAQANQEIEAARKAFWSQYPNGPRHAATEEAFANALLAKDLYYLSLAAQEGCNGPAQIVLDRLSKMDNGIPTDAYLAFCELVDAVRNQLGVRAGQSLPFDAILKVIPTALTLEQFDRYKQARDWSEFARAGRAPYRSWKDLENSKDPHLYANFLVQRPTNLVGHSFPVQLREAAIRFKYLADKHGNNTMLGMAEKIMGAPRGTTTAIGRPDQVVADAGRMARADDLRKAGWNDAQASMCSGRFIENCYLNLIGEIEPASAASAPVPRGRGRAVPGSGTLPVGTDASVVPAGGQPQGTPAPSTPARPSATRPARIPTNGQEPRPLPPNAGAGSTTGQPNGTAADRARTEVCDQRSAIQAQIAATNRERFEAERKMNQELSAYRQEMAKQHVPAAETRQRYNEKQVALKESYGVNALDQRTKRLRDELLEAQRACIAAVTPSPAATAQGRPQPPQIAQPDQASSPTKPSDVLKQTREEEAQRSGGQRPQPPAPVPAVPSGAAPKQLSSGDVAGIKAAVGWPADITGTVTRVEQRPTFPGSDNFFARIYFAESPDVFVYVVPNLTPKIKAVLADLTGQKITVHMDRLPPTTSGPVQLSIARAEDLSIRRH